MNNGEYMNINSILSCMLLSSSLFAMEMQHHATNNDLQPSLQKKVLCPGDITEAMIQELLVDASYTWTGIYYADLAPGAGFTWRGQKFLLDEGSKERFLEVVNKHLASCGRSASLVSGLELALPGRNASIMCTYTMEHGRDQYKLAKTLIPVGTEPIVFNNITTTGNPAPQIEDQEYYEAWTKIRMAAKDWLNIPFELLKNIGLGNLQKTVIDIITAMNNHVQKDNKAVTNQQKIARLKALKTPLEDAFELISLYNKHKDNNLAIKNAAADKAAMVAKTAEAQKLQAEIEHNRAELDNLLAQMRHEKEQMRLERAQFEEDMRKASEKLKVIEAENIALKKQFGVAIFSDDVTQELNDRFNRKQL